MDITRVRAARRKVPRLLELEGRSPASIWPGPGALPGAEISVRATNTPSDIPSNRGLISESQYQPWGYTLLGYQWADVSLRGTLDLSKNFPFNRLATQPITAGAATTPAVNAGTIGASQFNVGGFSQIGMQWRNASVGGSIRIDDYDESYGQDAAGGSPVVPNGGGARPGPVTVPGPSPVTYDVPASTGTIANSQFNDGGYGDVGQQWQDVTLGGDANLTFRAYIRYPDGQGPAPAPLPPASSASAGDPGIVFPSGASVNTGLIQNNQFNDGGFGNVGMQWRDVAVGGSVNTSYETWTVQPQKTGLPQSEVEPGGNDPHPQASSANETNRGQLVNGQFNDGGFGDVGYQWQHVNVAGNVATSYNGVSIQPELNDTGPITIANLTLGKAGPPAINPFLVGTTTAAIAGGSAGSVGVASAPNPGDLTENDSTNSGVVTNAQFSDGGFGDIGLQWRDVTVGGDVLAVHNSLSIQPENANQGQITVSGIQFPSLPANPSAPSSTDPSRTLPADPALISGQGGTPGALPAPTGSRDQSFPINSATNSGPVTNGQFSDGGFGDIGLQWSNVKVGGPVRLVHNSLSIQPEGSNLAGVSVSDVHFGATPAAASEGSTITPAQSSRRPAARVSRPIHRTIQPPRAGSPARAKQVQDSLVNPPVQRRGATNNRALTGRQTADSRTANVTLQWLNTYGTPDNIVIVHNVLAIHGWGRNTGRISLDGVQFAANTPRVNGLTLASTRYLAQSRPGSSLVTLPGGGGRALLTVQPNGAGSVDHATNSGQLDDAQFSDGGFGDVGLQWRDVTVGGGVDVIHNSLSVNITGNDTGPIQVANVDFRSGALDGLPTGGATREIVPPPRVLNRNWAPPRGTVGALPRSQSGQDLSANNGIITGGQFSDGGFGNVALQTSGVNIPGHVTIIHNVLEIQTAGNRTGPINLSGIRFE